MLKKYLLLLSFFQIIIYILITNFHIFFTSYTKNIHIKIKDKEYIVPLGTTYKEIKDKYSLDNNNEIYDDAVLYNNQEIDNVNNIDTINKISLNNANLEELITLPGIGEKIANRIIEYRNTYGPFWAIEDIKNIKGIGDKKYEMLKEYLII